jgi:hypothetical protein
VAAETTAITASSVMAPTVAHPGPGVHPADSQPRYRLAGTRPIRLAAMRGAKLHR